MQRKRKVSIEEVLPQIGTIPGKRYSSNRMLLFTRSLKCACCGLKGTHFWLERSGCFPLAYNLYGYGPGGKETMLTQDHIIPRSKGGSSTLDNLQLLCSKCNTLKGAQSLTIEQLRIKRTQPKVKKTLENRRERRKQNKYAHFYFKSRDWLFLAAHHSLKFLNYPPIYIGIHEQADGLKHDSQVSCCVGIPTVSLLAIHE